MHKIGIAAKEAAETEYWLELLVETNGRPEALTKLVQECDELLRIMVRSGKTAKRNRESRN